MERQQSMGAKGCNCATITEICFSFRRLDRIANESGLIEEFEVTLETTHHGPLLDTPTLFIEIGSTEEHWGRTDAAEVWADDCRRV